MSFRSLLALSLAVFAGSLNGQDFRATITGQVTDGSGFAIAGAKVRAVQRTTNQSIDRETNAEGFYTLPYLQPSTYDIEVTAPGFRRMRRENITLLVADRLDLSFKMELGEVSQQITVTAEAVELLKTADASGGLGFDSLMTS
jgi:Carboxypeptidase regulatory-like domain